MKYNLKAIIILFYFLMFGFMASISYGQTAVKRGTQVITGDLYIGGSIQTVDDILATQMSPELLALPEKTPVNAVAASGKMISTGTLAADGSGVTIGAVVYTLKTSLTSGGTVPYEVLLGANTGATADNLVSAISGTTGAGTTYGTGTVAHPLVGAEVTDTDDITITASTKGTAGNSIVTVDDSAQISWNNADVALVGGINGTVGIANETCADGSYMYHCITANTISGTNWRRVTLGTAY